MLVAVVMARMRVMTKKMDVMEDLVVMLPARTAVIQRVQGQRAREMTVVGVTVPPPEPAKVGVEPAQMMRDPLVGLVQQMD